MKRDNDDIEFDFFDDEPETREAQSTQRVRMPKRGGGGPRKPIHAPQGLTPVLRLMGVIAFAILVVVLLVFWVQSCQGASKRNAYRHYMENVHAIAAASDGIGRDLNELLTTTGQKVSDIEPKLRGYAQREEQDVAKVRSLTPPGPLREEHRSLIEALQFRVSGLQGLAGTFRQTATSKDTTSDAKLLADQAQRLVTSDVVWADLFKAPAMAELQKQGVTGVAVPDSTFVLNPDLATRSSMGPLLQRIRGASTGGTPTGVHGTNIVSVKALPGESQLTSSAENTITASTDLGFAITVQDSGDSQEVGIKVTLTIQKSPEPIVRTQTIDLINSGDQKTVVFKDLGQVPFAQKTSVKVDVQPVPGEHNTSNNSAEYPVIFSLG